MDLLAVVAPGPKPIGAILIPIGIIVLVFAAILIAAAVGKRRERERHDAIQRMLGLLGFRMPADAVGRALSPLEALAARPGDTVWSAEGMAGAVPMALVEHRYTTGSGKNRQLHQHSVVSIEVPTKWPVLEVYPENFFHKIGELFGSKDIQLEDGAFNKRFRVKCSSEDFALMFLTPEAQMLMMGWDKIVRLTVGHGRIVLHRKQMLDAAGWEKIVADAAALRASVPEELESWEG